MKPWNSRACKMFETLCIMSKCTIQAHYCQLLECSLESLKHNSISCSHTVLKEYQLHAHQHDHVPCITPEYPLFLEIHFHMHHNSNLILI